MFWQRKVFGGLKRRGWLKNRVGADQEPNRGGPTACLFPPAPMGAGVCHYLDGEAYGVEGEEATLNAARSTVRPT